MSAPLIVECVYYRRFGEEDVEVMRTVWRDGSTSYDVHVDGGCITMDESLDDMPTDEQIDRMLDER